MLIELFFADPNPVFLPLLELYRVSLDYDKALEQLRHEVVHFAHLFNVVLDCNKV